MKKVLWIGIFILISTGLARAQSESERFEHIKAQMDLMISESPGLEDPVDLTVSNVPLAEFLRALGTSNKINLSIDPEVKGQVVNNFNNVSVAEVLLFLAKHHNLDYEFTGNIIYVKPYVPPVVQELKIPRFIPLTYDTATSNLSVELRNDSLHKVAKLLTQRTGRNVVYKPALENKRLSIYLENVPFDNALDKIAFANNLSINKTEDGFYLIEEPVTPRNGETAEFRLQDLSDRPRARGEFLVDSNLISLDVENQPLELVVKNLFDELGAEYFLYSKLNGTVTTSVTNITLDDLLVRLFSGTAYTYLHQDSIYIIGERSFEGLRSTKRIYLKHRSVERVVEVIPGNIRQGLEIKEFNDLNSILASGAPPEIRALEAFIESIDQSVPVVLIEVIIVDYQRRSNVSTGIQAGTGENPSPGTGQLFPAFDYSFNANDINALIESFNGFGALNLGPVTPNFYLNLKFLEDNGVLNVKSTPKLSTLNGHEANLSIGNTEYYVVEQTNVTGGLNPIPITTRNYNQVQANFTLRIRPFVSADDQVTLDISVEQSDFTARISPDAPPGMVTRTFTSMIRVKGDEMIVLGGLEERSSDNSGRGVPWISRIPVLKWLFSSRTDTDSKTKLNIFIKPTIIK